MNEEGTLLCAVNIEWLNKQGVVQRKVTNKKASLRLVRNDMREIFVEVTVEKAAPIKLQLKGINVHKKFMNEGKASIVFQPLNCTLYLSNAPPGQLLTFLKTMFVKMTGDKTPSSDNKSLRTQLLSGKGQTFEDVSPVTNNELNKAFAKVSKATSTTPSPLAKRKRKVERDEGIKAPAAKRLYTASPISNEPLDMEQKEVLDACVTGKNVFFTGSAGTGKSYLLKRIIRALPPDVTIATASTGVAACHIGGITLHQFASIGTGEASLEHCYDLAFKQPGLSIWRKCKHLIIDEISMVEGDFFEKVEAVARKVRGNEKPFGGIQLILCGDFFQLPPIGKQKLGGQKAKFCFQTEAWNNCRLNYFELKQVYRQNDIKFVTILNKIRIGTVDKEVAETLSKTSKQKIERDGILATRLCTHTKDVDIINETKLRELPGETKIFQASDSGISKMLDQQTTVPGKLELKIGAQVMLLKNINISSGLVNGARGIVKDFKEGLPVVMFKNKTEYIAKHEKWIIKTANGASLTRKQVPLKLAWAFSIHKSQGLTLDCVEMSLSRVFEAGQAYVALSRAQSLDALRVLDFNASQVWANPVVVEFYKNLDYFKLIPLGISNKVNVGKSLVKRKPFGARLKCMDKPLGHSTWKLSC